MATIPTFPAFRRLDLSDRPVIEAITRRFPPYSDFSFTSLWAWDTDETCALSLLNGNLVVRLKDYAADDHFFSFLGCNRVVDTARTLLRHALDLGLPATLRLVPEATVIADDRLQKWLSVEDDPDNADYVCSVPDWAALAGGAFRNHRRAAARCRRCLSPKFERLDLGDPAIQSNDRRPVPSLGGSSRPPPNSRDSRHEFAALQRLLALPASHRPQACGLLCGDRLVGFSISEGILGSPYAIAHFRKTDREIEGARIPTSPPGELSSARSRLPVPKHRTGSWHSRAPQVQAFAPTPRIPSQVRDLAEAADPQFEMTVRRRPEPRSNRDRPRLGLALPSKVKGSGGNGDLA